MSFQKFFGSAAAAASLAAFVWAPASQAAMLPSVNHPAPYVQHVDCAAGFHLGPVGGCILGTDDHDGPPVVEHRDADVGGCETKSVKRTDSDGNSETHTRTNC